MPKTSYLTTSNQGINNNSNSSSTRGNSNGQPIFLIVLAVSIFGNLMLLVRNVMEKPLSQELLAQYDLPSTLVDVASELKNQQLQFSEALEEFLPWNTNTKTNTNSTSTSTSTTATVTGGGMMEPEWLQSHIHWHLTHLSKTRANWKSKATRWAIDAEEVAHSMLGGTAGSSSNSQDQAAIKAGFKHHLIRETDSSNDNSKSNIINLWNPSVTSKPLPKWLQNYFAWHQQQVAALTAETLPATNFLIMYAPFGSKSGGMTDRVRPFPVMLRIAAENNRVLLIRWERPYPLEEYLLPPLVGGCNWSVPSLLVPNNNDDRQNQRMSLPVPLTDMERIYKAAHATDQHVVTTNYQSWNYGELFYKDLLKKDAAKLTAAAPGGVVVVNNINNSNNTIVEEEPDLITLYRDIWKVMFRPSPPVEKKIYRNLNALQLVPGEFATVHIRALYAVKERSAHDILGIVTNALNCVSTLRPGGPFFVASDSLLAIQMAMAYAEHHRVTLVTATHEREPLHIEFYNASDATLTAADFYDGFVDMYIMAATRCVAHGKGGFARWGQLLGYSASCTEAHNGFKSATCKWWNATTEETDLSKRRGYGLEETSS